ncbi:MAG TPA: MarR family transcriptional regulator [Nocardioidaceae bacterium]|nr:MarR family transcriptional regulator [Nocardioidaceae bacterium]
MPRSAEGDTSLDIDSLYRVVDAVRRALESVVDGDRLSVDRWRVLALLCGDGPSSMSHLGERTRITPPSLTRAVDRLVDDALAYREVDFADRRRVLVHASARGRRLYDRLTPAVRDAEAAAVASLDAADVRVLQNALAQSIGM